jgi:hypothetical protein
VAERRTASEDHAQRAARYEEGEAELHPFPDCEADMDPKPEADRFQHSYLDPDAPTDFKQYASTFAVTHGNGAAHVDAIHQALANAFAIGKRVGASLTIRDTDNAPDANRDTIRRADFDPFASDVAHAIADFRADLDAIRKAVRDADRRAVASALALAERIAKLEAVRDALNNSATLPEAIRNAIASAVRDAEPHQPDTASYARAEWNPNRSPVDSTVRDADPWWRRILG